MRKSPRDISHMDITSALQGWTFQSGQVNVRLIRGNDGKPKLQLRLDLGLLQMELNGRPDGKRPHHSATELEFHTRKLDKHCQRHGSDANFALAPADCQALREESAMFYHRYLSLFVLEQYEAVIRDTQHNLNVLDLCKKYGRNDYDRMCLEQYRPYILMMNIRAKACEALRQNFVQTAMAYLRGGVRQIIRLIPKEHRLKARKASSEIHILLEMLRQIKSQLPPNPREVLQHRLSAALKAEKYEEAAQLRDQLEAMEKSIAEQQAKKAARHKKNQANELPPAVETEGSGPAMPKKSKAGEQPGGKRRARRPRQKPPQE